MTTKGRTTPKRDKHPARSARVLTTGISIASVLGLTSAYSLAAQLNPPVPANEPNASAVGVAPSVAPLANQPVVAPTQPAAATPVAVIAQTRSVPTTQAPAVQIPVSAVPVTMIVLQPSPAATRSNGSK